MSVFGVRSMAGFAAGVLTVVGVGWGVTTFRASAAPGPTESTYVPVSPVRILDTRDPVNLGVNGPFVSPSPLDLQVTGAIPTAGGTAIVVPVGATGVALNVTVVSPSAAGFVSVRPADAVGAPTTSSLNFQAGATVPNAVDVQLPVTGGDAGRIEITFDAYGAIGPSTEVLVDVVGYTTRQGIQDLVADLALKANRTEVYSRGEADGAFTRHGEIVMTHAADLVPNAGVAASVGQYSESTTVGSGFAQMSLDVPARIGGVEYGLRSMEYCLRSASAATYVNSVSVGANGEEGLVSDGTNRTAAGCYTLVVNRASRGFVALWNIAGPSSVSFTSVTTTWAPVAQLDEPPLSADEPSAETQAPTAAP